MSPDEIARLCTSIATQIANRMIAPVARRVRLMIARAVVTAIDDAGPIQVVQVKILDGEIRDGVEVLHQYGITSNAPGKREGLYFSVGGDRDHGIMIAVGDRAHRLTGLAPGEVALYDDLGQIIHLTREGIVITCAGLPVLLRDAPKVRLETERLEVTGDIIDRCDAGGRTMQSMRGVFDGHGHPGDNAPPSEKMS